MEPAFETLRLTLEQPAGAPGGAAIAVVEMRRPEMRNALSALLLRELGAAMHWLRDRRDVRAVVLTGAGPVFCSGGDLKVDVELMGGLDAPWTPGAEQALRESVALGQLVFDRMEALPQPIVAALNGPAVGAGLELALACDLIVAAQSARVRAVEVALGYVPGWGGTQRLAKRIGLGRALDLQLTARWVAPDEAERLGLVTQVVPDAELMPAARALAGTLAAHGPLAMAWTKSLARAAFDLGHAEGSRRELEADLAMYRSWDFREGIRAFYEKRKPEFRGD